MISKRLKGIADLVPNGSFPIDVGTDHALVPIYLIKSNKCNKVIASDISNECIIKSKNNVNKEKLNKKIKLYCTDGLNNIEDRYDTIIISGLGASTIIKILKYNLNVKNIIIQSNNNLNFIRNFMYKNNYKIDKELVIKENGFYYDIIKYEKGKEKLKKRELLFGKSGDREYYNFLYNKYYNIYKSVPWNLKIHYLSYLFILKKYYLKKTG
jgi:tRNA (adenine22-N1)-methyltransferase